MDYTGTKKHGLAAWRIAAAALGVLIVGGFQLGNQPVAQAASTPSLILTPATGTSGTTATVAGANLPNRSAVTLSWDGAAGVGVRDDLFQTERSRGRSPSLKRRLEITQFGPPGAVTITAKFRVETATSVPTATAAPLTNCTRMMVPSYDENDYTSDWDALMSSGSGAAPYSLFNPSNGPGTAYSSNWAAIIGRMHKGRDGRPRIHRHFDTPRCRWRSLR